MEDYFPFVNVPLPYAYNALEPYIDAQTMHLHYDAHLQTYIDNLNAALKDHPSLQMLSLDQLIQRARSLPPDVGTPIARNAGGVYNHRFYFDGLTPDTGLRPAGVLADALNRSFGSDEAFRRKLTDTAKSVFGSGYAWLVADRCGNLKIITTANQDTPLTLGLCPILNVDVWEHAYYLKHFNRRADYLGDWWNVVNWPVAEERYAVCTGHDAM